MSLASQTKFGTSKAQVDVFPDGKSLTVDLLRICGRPIADDDRACAARLLLDWVGVAFAGSCTRQGAAVRETVQALGQDGTSHILAFRDGTLEQAAYINGSYGTLLEMDDLHRASILHAGDVVIPAALAMAQEVGSSGPQLLDALVVGYEVALRIGTVAAKGGYSAWYNTGTCGVFGAAMAAAHAAGLSEEQKCDALGHAGMQASGLWQCRLEPTDSKCLATAHAARAGVTSALTAAAGLKGARLILEGELGFFPTLYPKADTNGLTADHASWMIHDVSLKPWPACRHVHPAIGAMLSLRDKADISAIRKIDVLSYAAGVAFCDNAHPKTAHEARFSFQHTLAIALRDGAPKLNHYRSEAMNDVDIIQLREKINVSEDPSLTSAFPEKMGAVVTATLNDEKELTRKTTHAPGDPQMPLSPQEQRDKFMANLEAAGVDAQVAQSLLRAVTDLPTAASLNDLGGQLSLASETVCRNPNKELIP